MTFTLRGSRIRHQGITAIVCVFFATSMFAETTFAQTGRRNEKPANRDSRQVWRQPQEGQPRQRPPRMGERRNGQRPNMRGRQRNMEGRPPHEDLDGPPGPHGPKTKNWQELGKTQRKEIIKFLRKHFPRMSEELKKLRERNPEAFKRRIRRVIPEVRRVMEMMKVDPERAKLHIQERKLDMQMRHKANLYRKSQDDLDQVKLRKDIDELATQAFDIQLQLRQLEISHLQARMSDLATRLEEARKLRPEMIQQRVTRLLSADRNRKPPEAMTQPAP